MGSKVQTPMIILSAKFKPPFSFLKSKSIKCQIPQMSGRRKRARASDMDEDVSEEEFKPQVKKRKTDQKEKVDKKSKNNQKNAGTASYAVHFMQPGEECPELPPEILVQIFGYLPRKDLTSAGQVNHHWQLCSRDDSLFWLPIWKIKLREDKGGYEAAQYWDKTSSYLQGSGYKKLVPKAAREHHFGPYAVNARPTSATMIQGGTHTGLNSKHSHDVTMFVVLKDKKGQPIAMTRFVDPNACWAPDLSKDCYRHTIRPINNIASGVKGYGLDIEVQPWRIERDVREGNARHQAVGGFVRRIVNKLEKATEHRPNITEYFDPKECYIPAFVPTLSEQPEKIKGVKLHQYQLSAINWMLETETSRKTFTVSPLFPAVANLSVFLGENEHKFVTNDNAKEYDWNLAPKGGILADEMGLGKTMEMIGLILSNPMKEAPENKPYFSTKATLVACPNHLVQQWHDEIQKHSTDKLKIIQLTTINHIKATNYQQIIDADVVIVSYNLLQNKNYVAFPNDPKTFGVKKLSKYELKRIGVEEEASVAELTAYKRLVLMRESLDTLQDKEPKSIKGVVLDHFHWHRIVMDEGHELIADKTVNDFMLANFKKTYAWYMTGTPFPTFDTIDGVRKFLDFTPPKPNETANNENQSDDEDIYYGFSKYRDSHLDNVNFEGYSRYKKSAYKKFGNWNKWVKKPYHILYFDDIINEMLFENLLWRNTKASVADEYKMTDTKHECVLLDFTPIESAIYEDLSQIKPGKKHNVFMTAKAKRDAERETDPLRELCCKLDPIWGDNLTDVRKSFIDKKGKDIDMDQTVIQTLHNRHVECKAMLANKNSGGWDVYEARKFVADFPTKLDEVKQKLATDQKIKKQLEDYDPEVELKNEKEKLIEKRGTKLGNLVVYLQKLFANSPTTRVIIFSQFSDYLQLIEGVLEQHDISSCTVEGNVYRKTKALGKFKDGESEVKVILLSLSKAASGTNLIEASHVILMDPMSGSREEAQAYEQQAIGRAQRQGQTKPVTVVRFIIKDTIEHSLYLRNVSQNKLNRSSSMLVRSGSLVNFNLDNEENSGNDDFSGDLNDAEAGDTDAMSDD